MRYIRTTNSQIEFIEANDNGQILNSIGLQLGEVYFQIKNGKVAFYLNDSERPFDNFIWSTNIPLTIDDETYETEDEVSEALHSIMNDSFQEQLDQLKEDLAAEEARAQEAEEQLDDKIDDETSRAVSAETHIQDEVTALSGTVATFDERITRNTNDISALTNTVNAEIARSTGKDAEHDAAISGLTNSLNNEIARATSAETSLHNDIVTETNRAQVAESDITNNLNLEIQNRIADVDAEENRALIAESGITANLTNEVSRATARENAIDDKVDAEVTRSTQKDAEHDSLISGLTSDLATEVSNRVAADNLLQANLTNEVSRATSAETVLHNEILAETNRALAAESALTNALNDEISRSTAKDASQDALISGLTTSLQNEINRATGAENNLRSDLNTEIQNRVSGDTLLQSNIDAEEARALAAESALTDALNAEIARSTSKDASQDASISGLTTSLNAEISRATGVENGLRTDLNAEISARTADVDAEEARALAAESGITANLNAEIQNRINAVSGLTERVADDEAAFGAALVDLNNKINAVSGENASQTIQISGLNASLNTEISRATGVENALRSDLTNETSARVSADTALQTSKADKVSAVASAIYNSTNKTIDFKNISGTVISSIDARDFIKDGMVDTVTISNNNLVITFNTDAGKEDIVISLASIFDPTNYYTKSEVDTKLGNKADSSALTEHIGDTVKHITAAERTAWNAKSDFSGSYNDLTDKPTIPTSASQLTNDVGYITSSALNGYATEAYVSGFTYDKQTIDNKIAQGGTFDPTLYYQKSETSGKTEIQTALNGKQNTLSAGTGIDITSDVISVTGGSQPVDAYTKAESDAKFATITNFNSHSGDTTMHVTASEKSTWNAKADASSVYNKTEIDNKLSAKPNVWCGDETAWSQISGSTESGTIYLVY